MHTCSFGDTQSSTDEQRDEKELTDYVRRLGKNPLLSTWLTKDDMVISISS